MGEIKLWEIRSHRMLMDLKEHLSTITKVQLFNKDTFLLSSAKDRSMLLWDVAKEKRVASYNNPMGGINNFEMMGDGTESTFISVGQDRRITWWDLRAPKSVANISSDPQNKADLADELFALSLDSQNRHLVTGGKLGIVRAWDIRQRSFLGGTIAHSKACTHLKFSYNDKLVISTGEDAQILTFKLEEGIIN